MLDSTKVGRREAMVNWIAPEMIFGNSEELRMTLESDMYAFACVVYEASVMFHYYFLPHLVFRFTSEELLSMIRMYSNA
jgi:serine/threonine protein kinase